MDIKTNEKILEILLEITDEDNFIELPIPLVSERLPDSTEGDIIESMQYLEHKELVKIEIADATIYYLWITIKGLAYFMEKEDAKNKELIKKHDDRQWELIKIAIGYFVGLLSGVALMWFKVKIFP